MTPTNHHPTSQEVFIIGIGASAGSLDFIKELVHSLPTHANNMALVLAQHRSAEYTTHIHQIIKAHKPWTIEIIEDKVKPQAGHIYINPSGDDLWMKDGILHLKTSSDSTTATPSIDRLFKSLAKEIGHRSIGVILSGTGNDATLGAEYIKKYNGHVIVQDPDEAKFDAMPLSVINAGHADKILPASLIFTEVESYLKNAQAISGTTPRSNRFKDILNMLSLSFGTDFGSYKSNTIKRRLDKRIDSLNLEGNEEYYQYLQSHPGEIGQLFETMLIGVTEFFRNQKAFDELRQYLKKIIASKSKGDSIRIWSVGCSTGEEPYSLALLLHEILGEDIEKYSIQIFATDIDQRAIAIARKGIYNKDDLKNVPDEWLSRYFYKSNGNYELKKIVRQHVLFSKHDITTDPPFVKLDLLTCRNLLIYFDSTLQKKVIPVFHYALNTKGYLFLGKSETISNLGDLFTSLESQSRIFQKNSNAEINTLRYSSFRRKYKTEKTVPVFPEMSLEEIVAETITKTFEDPYVVIGEDMETLLVKGSLQPYLEISEGSLNSNILKILNPAIHAELRTCFNKIKKSHENCESNLINFELRGEKQYLRLTLKPLVYAHSGRQNYLVIFKKVSKNERFDISEEKLGQDNATNVIRIMELEQELEATREHLKAFTEELEVGNEELQAVNEELQSANEELKSSNEELETSNEELQSANEELQTANSELAMSHQMMISKEKQLIAAKEELEITKDRFETALENSTIFIGYQDKDLRYYWLYNTSVEFNDQNVLGKNDLELLGEDGVEINTLKQKVLFTGEAIQQEIERNGSYWDMSIKPIIKNGEIEGVKTVAVNITDKKKAQLDKKRSYDIIDALLKDLDDTLLVVNRERNVITFNDSLRVLFYKRFGKKLGQNQNLKEVLKDHPESLDETEKLLNRVFEGQKINIDKLKLEDPNHNESPFYYQVQGIPLTDENGNVEAAALISGDISNKVKAEEQIEYVIRHTANLVNDEFFHDITDQLYSLFGAKHIFFARVGGEEKKLRVISYRKDGQIGASFNYNIDNSPIELIYKENELQVYSDIAKAFPNDELLRNWNSKGYVGIPVTSPTSGKFLGAIVMAHPSPIKKITNGEFLFKIMAMRAGAEIETNHNIQELKYREKQLQNISRNLPEMIYEYISTDVVDNDRFTYVSKACRNIYEVEPEDLLRDANIAWDAIYEDDLEDFVRQMEDASECMTTFVWTGRIIGNQSYKIRWVKITAQPERINDTTLKWYGVISDISRIKHMENELQHAKNQAEKLAESKEEFLAVMSHEIRTPLNGIMGITELMLEEASEKDMEYLSVLKFSADNLMALVNNILDFSKINAGKLEALESRISLMTLLKHLKHSHEFKARENNNKLLFEIDNNLPEVCGDDMIITQILNNLLSNANKFTKSGEVKLEVEKLKESSKNVELRFTVSDTGVGISDEDIDKIFEKFKQLGDKDQRTGGTGLGLVIVKKLVEFLHSQLSIKSKKGKGSTFSFSLTLKKASATKNNKEISEGKEFCQILVADDMADNRDLISKYLSRVEAFKVDFAANGQEVVNMVAQKNYDLIFMDLDMPAMNGHEAAAHIRGEKEDRVKKIPIIALSTENLQMDNNQHFDGLISKPVSYNDLRSVLKKYLDHES